MDPNLIKESLDSLPESTVEKVLNPTAEVLGDSAGGLVRTLFYPFLKLNIYSKEKLENFEKNIHAKINQIPDEYRDSSKLPEFLETLEKSKYKIGEAEIRTMFENLLSKTLDSRTNQSITPRYSMVLSQLNSKDATVLNLINQLRKEFSPARGKIDVIPIVKILRKMPNNAGETDLSGPIMLSSNKIFSTYTMELDNLRGLGIIEVDFTNWLSSEFFTKMYTDFETSNFFQLISDPLHETDGATITPAKGVIQITAFGNNLLEILD